MVQQLGETVDAVMAEDEKQIENILNEHPKGEYWILIAYKAQTNTCGPLGEYVIKRLIKAYKVKPMDLVGSIRMHVKDGEILDTDVFMPDRPIDWAEISKHCGLEEQMVAHEMPGLGRTYQYSD